MDAGRVLVPIRAVSDALGVNVSWMKETQQITLIGKGKQVELVVGQDFALVDGVHHKLDVPAKIVDGRTLVPMRFVSQAFGAGVNWVGKKQLVEITW